MFERLQEWYWKRVPYDYRPRQLWYRVKCRLWHRYNTVRCRSLPSTWCDRDAVLEHAVFEILGQFVEKELEKGRIEEQEQHTELRELWRWWKEVYLPWSENPQQELETLEQPELKTEETGNEHCVKLLFVHSSPEAEAKYNAAIQRYADKEVEMRDTLTAKLKRVIELRPNMWT